jgi:hypothetical protein
VLAATGLVVYRGQKVSPGPARSEEHPAEMAQMLNRQVPKMTGPCLDRGGHGQAFAAGSRAAMQDRSVGRQHGLSARSAVRVVLDFRVNLARARGFTKVPTGPR